MSKAREAWVFQEVVASAKLNQANTDWITKGQEIFSAYGSANVVDTNNAAGVTTVAGTLAFAPWTFNPAKQIADRLRVTGLIGWDNGGGSASVWVVEYTDDSGVGWINVPLATAILPVTAIPAIAYAGGGTVGPGYTDFDISAIAATQWLGLRMRQSVAGPHSWVAWALNGYLFNSIDTPH